MPGPSSNTVFGSNIFQTAITEVLSKNIKYQMADIDPVFRKSIGSSQGVVPVSEIGRDLKIIRSFYGSVTGEIEMSDSELGLYGDNSNTAIGTALFKQGPSTWTNAKVWPTGLNGANAKTYRLGVHMREMKGALTLTMAEYNAEALPATIIEVVQPKIKGFARNIAFNLCNQFYTNQAADYRLATVAAGFANVKTVAANDTLRFSPSNYAVNRFTRGMRISFWDVSGAAVLATATSKSVFYVTKVDALRNYVECMAEDGATVAAVTAALAGGSDYVYLAGQQNLSSASSGIAGVNSWMKFGTDSTDYSASTNAAQRYLLGAERDTTNQIDVDLYPEFKSLGIDMNSAPLTEHTLRKILRRFHMAKEPLGQTIDHLVASDGVWLAYEAQKIGREYIDRTNRLSSMSKEGSADEDATFTMDGKTYTTHTSGWVEDGTVFGIKLRDGNWKRMMPPKAKGVKSFDQSEAFAPFEFVAPHLTGTGSIHVPIYNTQNGLNQLTEFMQLPGMMRLQMVPDQPAGLKIVRCASDRIYGSAISVSSGLGTMDVV